MRKDYEPKAGASPEERAAIRLAARVRWWSFPVAAAALAVSAVSCLATLNAVVELARGWVEPDEVLLSLGLTAGYGLAGGTLFWARLRIDHAIRLDRARMPAALGALAFGAALCAAAPALGLVTMLQWGGWRLLLPALFCVSPFVAWPGAVAALALYGLLRYSPLYLQLGRGWQRGAAPATDPDDPPPGVSFQD